MFTLIAILVILWLLGFGAHVAGDFIHLLLLIALVLLLSELVMRRY